MSKSSSKLLICIANKEKNQGLKEDLKSSNKSRFFDAFENRLITNDIDWQEGQTIPVIFGIEVLASALPMAVILFVVYTRGLVE
jgi:hypothetical protein